MGCAAAVLLHDRHIFHEQFIGTCVALRDGCVFGKAESIQDIGQLCAHRDSGYGFGFAVFVPLCEADLAADIVIIKVDLKPRKGNTFDVRKLFKLVFGERSRFQLHAAEIACFGLFEV